MEQIDRQHRHQTEPQKDGYAKHLVVSNGVPGKTIDYRTGAIN